MSHLRGGTWSRGQVHLPQDAINNYVKMNMDFALQSQLETGGLLLEITVKTGKFGANANIYF